MYEPNLDSMIVSYIKKDTFCGDLETVMQGKFNVSVEDEYWDLLQVFKNGNTKDVEVFYDKLAAVKNIDGGAAAAEAAVPLADVFSNHVAMVLDNERMNIELKTVDIPRGSMIPSKFHSRQLHELKRFIRSMGVYSTLTLKIWQCIYHHRRTLHATSWSVV